MLDSYTQIAYNKGVDKTCTKGVKHEYQEDQRRFRNESGTVCR